MIGGHCQAFYVAGAPVPVVPAGLYRGGDPQPVEGLIHALNVPGVDVHDPAVLPEHSEPVPVSGSVQFHRESLSPGERLRCVEGPEVPSPVSLLVVDGPSVGGLACVDPDAVVPVGSQLPEPEEPRVQLVLDVALFYAGDEPVMEFIGDPRLPADVSHGAPVGLRPADSIALDDYGSIGVFLRPLAEVER